jgi:alanyl-tRNA synthetase
MNKSTVHTALISFASGIALAGTTLYWRRRERAVRESLTASRDWETNVNSNTDIAWDDQREAQEAAELLDARVEDLPERITALDEERRDRRRELDAVRERWAGWTIRADDTTPPTDPPVHVIEFEHGELPDAQAFAKHAMNEDGIHLIAAHGDSSFAVTVSEALSDSHSAEDIARKIVAEVGGGAGGNDRMASGGGGSDVLGEACRHIKKKLTRSDTVPAADQK